jgi:hypothetical protein
VVLYRIEGGGHGWPGGPLFLPARVIGPIPGISTRAKSSWIWLLWSNIFRWLIVCTAKKIG